MSVPVPEPVHCFVFDELVGPKIHDQKSAVVIELGHYVPAQGSRRGALRFGGAVAQVAKFPALADLPLPWTLAVWIRRAAESAASTLLSSDSGGIKIEQWGTAGRLGITQYGVRDWQSAATLPLSQWCHLVLVAESEQTQFYLDGVLTGSIPQAIPLPRKWLGSSGGWTEFLQASIEDLRIYDLPLTPAQVSTLANPESPGANEKARLVLARENGDAFPRAAALELSPVPAGRRGSLDLQLANQGTVPLIFTPTLHDSSGLFSLKLPASRVVAPGATTQLSVVFRPQLQGPAQSTLTIESNDPQDRSIVLPITAIGDAPAELPAIKLLLAKTPVVAEERRWLGRVLVGGRKAFPLHICNTGSATLRFELAADGPWGLFTFWQGAGPFELEPGGEFCADLAFSPTAEAAAQAAITIRSNDPDNPSCHFSVYGRGMPARPALYIGAADSAACWAPLDSQPVTLRAPVGQTMQQLICLRNAGGGTVTLRAPIAFLDPSDDAFTVEQPASLTIPLGGQVTVPITFTPTTGGQKTGKLRISWDGGISDLQLVAQAML